MMERSLNVPGSDSSALQIKYTGRFSSGLMKLHFKPQENPAPAAAKSRVFDFVNDVVARQSQRFF